MSVEDILMEVIKMGLKTKWFEENSIGEIESKINGFGLTHIVRATQTHITFTPSGLVYNAVVFYEPEKESQDLLK